MDKKTQAFLGKYSPLFAILVGFIAGGLSFAIQFFVDDVVLMTPAFFARAGCLWLLLAFLLSKWSPQLWKSLVSAACFMLFSTGAYYLGSCIANNHLPYLTLNSIVWIILAGGAGLLCGMFAHWANAKKNWMRYAGRSFLPAVFLAEIVMEQLHYEAIGAQISNVITLLIIALLLWWLCAGKDWNNPRALLWLVIVTACGVGVYELIYIVQYYLI